jgi:hypothetical protein
MTMRHAAGGAGNIDEPERAEDPIWKDDAASGEERPETSGAEISRTGAVPGAIAGASAVGPTGGIIGAAAGEKSAAAENEDAEHVEGDQPGVDRGAR